MQVDVFIKTGKNRMLSELEEKLFVKGAAECRNELKKKKIIPIFFKHEEKKRKKPFFGLTFRYSVILLKSVSLRIINTGSQTE